MNALENAKLLARAGIPVFPSSPRLPDLSAAATCDVRQIEEWDARYPGDLIWMARCGCGFGLMALDCPRLRDFEFLVADLGALPRTLCVSRGSAGSTVYWFRVDTDANILLGQIGRGTRAAFRRSAVVAGGVHPASGNVYEVAGGGAFDPNRIATLPDAWVEALPRGTAGGGITTAHYAPRHEFNREEFLKETRFRK
jgi:hypothetical protein